ncbi:MAG: hypothetical protein D6815_12930, partial [Candidatus Dadabacteria bacterium]
MNANRASVAGAFFVLVVLAGAALAPGLRFLPNAAATVPASSTTTSSTTTTTMPLWPPPCGEVDFNGRLTATDALHVL